VWLSDQRGRIKLPNSVYNANPQRVIKRGGWHLAHEMSGPSPSTPSSGTTNIRIPTGTHAKLVKMAEERQLTLGQVVADLVDAAPRLRVQQLPAAPGPAAPNKASPAAQQKASGGAVLSHVTLGS